MPDTDEERYQTFQLEDYLRIIRERAWVILACVAIAFVIALVSSTRTTPLYSASAEVVYDKSSMNTAIFGYEISSYDYDRQRTIETAIAAIGRNESIAEGVQAQLATQDLPGAGKTPRELSGMVGTSAAAENYLVTISATSTDPEEAAAVADAFADQFILYRKSQARALVAEARKLIGDELLGMSASELESSYGLMMQDKYESLRIFEAMQDGDFVLMGRAAVPTVPFTPRTERNLILAVLVGLVLGVGLAFLVEHLDRRIKDEKTLERLSGLPVLATIPIVGRGWLPMKSRTRLPEAIGFSGDRAVLLEAFRTLRSSLQYFNVDGGLQKIVVTSSLPQEGKTVTSVNLAISLALSGKRVILVEADLRRPMVDKYLHIDNEIGLSNILAGTSSVPGALQLVEVDPFIPARSRKADNGSAAALPRKNLYCIPSGPLPPNPAELLHSTRMTDIISELEHMADYVLVDTPPLLPVSDALALVPSVDALILTAWLHSTTRDEITQVRELLARTGVPAIGIVAGGAKAGRASYYRRGYRYRGYGYQ